MDSPIVTRLFRQLFAHRACQSVRPRIPAPPPARTRCARRPQMRCYSTGAGDDGGTPKNESHWQQRTDVFPQDMSAEYEKYPMVTADQLRGRRERPRRVKMLTRDFIEGNTTTTISKLQLTSARFSIQSFIWVLLEASSYLHAWRSLFFQRATR